MKKHNWLYFLGFIFVFISACAATQPTIAPTGNPEQLVRQLETDLSNARADQVDVLSPGLFEEAQSAYIKAQEGLDKGAKLSAISKYVSMGNASLKTGRGNLAGFPDDFSEIPTKPGKKALKVGADKLGEPYEEVDKQYLALTKAIENDNLSYAQKKCHARFKPPFVDVEIMAIKDTALGNARQMMAEDAKIQKIAPQTYEEALQTLQDADAYIGKNPYAEESISKKASDAEFMAQRMIAISESSPEISRK